jgi:hypothetical protein
MFAKSVIIHDRKDKLKDLARPKAMDGLREGKKKRLPMKTESRLLGACEHRLR